MTFIEADSIDELLTTTLVQVMQGTATAPRGKNTVELVAAHLVLRDPRRNVLANPVRALNHSFSVAEWLWIVTGRNDVRTIGRFNKQIAKFSDDGRTFAGAYGPRLVQQLPYVLDTLRKDPSSRQAVVSIWTPSPRGTSDVPCTTQFQWLIRNGSLDMITTMRSNDAWLGLPYDVFNFTQLQRQLALELGVEPGTYHHQAGSLHLYEDNFEQAAKLVVSEKAVSRSAPVVGLSVPAAVEAMLILIGDDGGDTLELRKLLARVAPEWRPYAQVLARRVSKEIIPDAPFTELVS